MLGKWFRSIVGGNNSAAKNAGDAGDAGKRQAGGAAGTAATVEYQGYTIEAAPISEGGQFRTAGFISGELDGEIRRIQFIRADTSGERSAAIEHSVAKGKQIVDEQGVGLLQREYL